MELLIVSGLSGAGKSVAMNALEDIGPNFWRTVIATGEYQRKLARGYWQEVKAKR